MSAFQDDVVEGTTNALARPLCWIYGLFVNHPRENGMSYREHFHHALYQAVRMGYGAFALVVHALFPFVFRTTGSRTIKQLHQEMEQRVVGVKKEKKEVVTKIEIKDE